MRKADGTEANLTRHSVEMEADLKGWKPLEPKDLVDREPNEKVITDAMETVKVILSLSDIEEEPEEWFEKQWYDLVKKKDGTVVLLNTNQNQIITDIVKKVVDILYYWKRAFLRKGEFELYWQVDVKRYVRELDTPLGKITIPVITVWDTPVFFNSKWCLSEWERSTYELYNNKEYDYDKMELEKKIMSDLILYSQTGVKAMDDSKSIFNRIKEECDKMWVLKKIAFKDWIFTLDFDWRIWFDTAQKQKPMVFPPFTITIDFMRKNLWLRWWHPHRWNGWFCLGWALTQIKDQCFKNKDIYGLVMWMVQFGNEWNSSDVGHSDRHPWNCIIRTYNDTGFDLEWLPVSKEEIILTVAEYNYTCVLDLNWLSNPAKELLMNSESFRALMKDRLNKDNIKYLVAWLLTTEEKKKDFIQELLK